LNIYLKGILVGFIMALCASNLEAQEITVPKDSFKISISKQKKVFSPKKASIYAALFPGLGQIYNGKYWKLPLVYGGYMGLIYVLGWNNNNYNDYFNAYKTIAMYQTVAQMSKKDKDYLNELFQVPYWNLNLNPSRFDSFKTQLKGGKDYYRRSRDLSVIAIAALHVLSIIDASVDANLSDFDINDKLTMHVVPMPMNFGIGPQVIGVNVAFNF
jgi:TM2 domain-containing membrane protein YozV